MTEIVNTYAARKRINDESSSWATRSKEPWGDIEDAMLIDYWINVDPQERDEITVSQVVERTVEACRVRCEIIRKKLGMVTVVVTTTTEARYIGALDDPEDCWWSPDYYIKGE